MLQFELHSGPARMLLTESTDPEFHRPFDVSVQYGEKAFTEAMSTAWKKLQTVTEGGSYIFDSIIIPTVRERLLADSPIMGEHGEPNFVAGSYWDDDGLHVLTRPDEYTMATDVDTVLLFQRSPVLTASVVGYRDDIQRDDLE
jgi:hypothetical protein